jgi:hypothetical protein
MELERLSTRLLCVENSILQELWTSLKTDCVVVIEYYVSGGS